MSSRALVLSAGQVLAPDGAWYRGGGVLVAGGRIQRVLASPSACARSGERRVDLGDRVLLPGFVDAHAHLDLSGFVGRVASGRAFPDWIRNLLAVRATLDEASLARAARARAERLLASGTTSVGDIDAGGRLARVAAGLALRVRRFREALDVGDSSRTEAVLCELDARASSPRTWTEGLSPHAPYTVSDSLWSALARRARSRRLPAAIHWAETPEERAWLEHGTGPFASLLTRSPRRSGLASIESAGLLGPRTALIHGNDATVAERSRIAESGACLVHCPGTHQFFERPPFDARAWVDAGVPLALGTDSSASNDDLDMAREMALFRVRNPGFGPEETLALATSQAARSIGLAGRAGTLAPGAFADLTLHEAPGSSGPECLEVITHGRGRVIGVWVAGRRVAGPRDGEAAEKSRPRPPKP